MKCASFLILTLLLLLNFRPATAQNELQQATYHLQQGEYRQAIQILENARDDSVYRDEVYFLLSRAYGMAGNYERGLQIVEEAREQFPDFTALEYAEAELIGYTDPYEAARKMQSLYREVSVDAGTEISNLDPEMIRAQAGQFYSLAGSRFHGEDRLQPATESLEQARELIPDSLHVHNNLIYTLMLREEYERAIDAADVALERFPGDRNIRLMRSQALSFAGREEDHLDEIEQMYRADPDDPAAAIAYGQALMKEGNALEAAEHFEEYLERNPRERRVYQMLIQLNRRQFEYGALAEVYRKKAEAFPEEPELRVDLAEVLAQIEEFEEAREQFQTLVEVTGEDRFELEKTRLYLLEEDWESAQKAYADLLSGSTSSTVSQEAYGDLVRLYEYLGKDEKALQTAEYAYNSHGEIPDLMELYIRQLHKKGKADQALEIAGKLIELDEAYSGLPYLVEAEQKDHSETQLELIGVGMRVELNRSQELSEQVQFGAQAAMAGEVELQMPLTDHQSQLEEHQNNLDEFARLIADLKDTGRQVEYYKELQNDYESNVWIMQQKAEALLAHGEYDEAENILTEAARINPDDTDLHRKIADIFEEIGNYEQAILSWERALGADRELEQAYENLIRLHRKTGTLDKLCDRWQARFRSEYDNEMLAEYLIDALHRAGRVEEARKIVEEFD